MKLHEHVVLHKFEGENAEQAPFASITIDDGVITARCDNHVWLPDAEHAPDGQICGICEEVWPNGTD